MTDLLVQPDLNTLTQDDLNRVRNFISASRAPNTKRAYTTAWTEFVAWCQQRGYSALPSQPDHVAAYAATLADAGAKPSTIQLRLSAISNAHRAANAANPVMSEIVRKAMSGIRRTLTSARTQKTPVTISDLRVMIAAMPDTLTGIRDRAILTLGLSGAFRRSELAALSVADVKFKRDEMVITLRRSKTDQEGEGLIKRIPMLKDEAICPLRSLKAWLKAAAISEGAIFRSVDRWQCVRADGLSDKSVAQVVKQAAQSVGLDPSQFGGHSLRSGFVTEGYNNNVAEADIMEVTGHHSLAVMRGYKRNAATAQPKAVRAVFGE